MIGLIFFTVFFFVPTILILGGLVVWICNRPDKISLFGVVEFLCKRLAQRRGTDWKVLKRMVLLTLFLVVGIEYVIFRFGGVLYPLVLTLFVTSYGFYSLYLFVVKRKWTCLSISREGKCSLINLYQDLSDRPVIYILIVIFIGSVPSDYLLRYEGVVLDAASIFSARKSVVAGPSWNNKKIGETKISVECGTDSFYVIKNLGVTRVYSSPDVFSPVDMWATNFVFDRRDRTIDVLDGSLTLSIRAKSDGMVDSWGGINLWKVVFKPDFCGLDEGYRSSEFFRVSDSYWISEYESEDIKINFHFSIL